MGLEVRDENATHAIEFTDEIVNGFPGRLTGSESMKNASKRIKQEFNKNCDDYSVKMETFNCNPRSFFGYFGWMAVLYIAGITCVLFNLAWVGFLLFVLAAFVVVSQFILYKEYIDFLWPSETGYNVIGSIEPKGEVKQQVIISGHHDSVHLSNYINKCPDKYQYIVAGGIGFLLFGLVLSLVFTIASFFNSDLGVVGIIVKVFLIIGIIFVSPFFRFTTSEISPAAGDNMIAVSIANEVASIINKEKKLGNNPLKNTRLTIISFDGEEAGVRGSRRYCEKHKQELENTKTYVLNIDSIYQLDQISFFNKDLNGIVPCSDEMANDCKKVAEDLGYQTKVMPMPFGGGATDGASFGLIGIESTNLIAMNASGNGIDKNTVYHTPRDTTDNIEKEAVKACIEIGLNYVLKKDNEILN